MNYLNQIKLVLYVFPEPSSIFFSYLYLWGL